MSRDERGGRDLGPGHEGLGASGAIVDGGKFVARKVNEQARGRVRRVLTKDRLESLGFSAEVFWTVVEIVMQAQRKGD